MSSQTTNYNLHKIDLTDAPPDITVLNSNWDTIDTELKNRIVTDNAISENTDLNTITTPGRYFVGHNGAVATLQNCPTNEAFHMYVGQHAGTYQRIVEYKTDTPKIYFRNYYAYDQTWGPWIRELTSIDTGALDGNKTIYVSSTGSDTTGTGAQGSAFATINKALSTVPKNLNGYTVTINVASGTYTGAVQISDFYGGHIVFSVGGSTRPILQNGMIIYNCKARIYVDTIETRCSASNTGFEVHYSPCVHFVNCQVNASTTKTGIAFHIGSMSIAYFKSCNVGNANVALSCNAAEAYVESMSGSGSNVGVHCTVGGRVGIQSASLNAVTGYYTETGGRIYIGGQVNVPWY